ncbi:hypothetical protein D3C71_1547940 [compost metagenome]
MLHLVPCRHNKAEARKIAYGLIERVVPAVCIIRNRAGSTDLRITNEHQQVIVRILCGKIIVRTPMTTKAIPHPVHILRRGCKSGYLNLIGEIDDIRNRGSRFCLSLELHNLGPGRKDASSHIRSLDDLYDGIHGLLGRIPGQVKLRFVSSRIQRNVLHGIRNRRRNRSYRTHLGAKPWQLRGHYAQDQQRGQAYDGGCVQPPPVLTELLQHSNTPYLKLVMLVPI